MKINTQKLMTVCALLTLFYSSFGANYVSASTTTEKRIVALETKCKALEDRIEVLETELREVVAHQEKMGNMFAVPNATVQKKADFLLGYAKDGNALEIKKLLTSGQNPNLSDENGMSPLMHGSQNGHTEIVRILLERKANPRLTDKQGMTALMYAAANGHAAAVRLLLNNIDTPVAWSDKQGRTALQLAESKGHKEVIDLLKGAKE
jgi:ankyrin repeat protein